MSYWTNDINSEIVLAPSDILMEAADELHERNSVLSVVIRESQLQDRVVLSFEIFNEKTEVALNLFEVSHMLDRLYPVVILPPKNDIPEFLREKRYVPGESGIGALSVHATLQKAIEGTPGKYVDNEWVSATPTEFREKLKNLLSQSYIKSRVISLLYETALGQNGSRDQKESTEAH